MFVTFDTADLDVTWVSRRSFAPAAPVEVRLLLREFGSGRNDRNGELVNVRKGS